MSSTPAMSPGEVTDLTDILDEAHRFITESCADGKMVVSWKGLFAGALLDLHARHGRDPDPIPMRLPCPECGALHVDVGDFATKPHHTHACQECGMVWRPAVVPTVGVQFLPGFLNDPADVWKGT